DERRWAKIVSLFVALGLVIGLIGYPLTAAVVRNRQQVKKAAAEINALVPSNERLFAVDPEYQPVFFYVRAPLEYVSRVQELPADAHYFLVQSDREAEATTTPRWMPRRAHLRARVRDYRKRELLLFEVGSK
ncbi:MAG TPA: hypothetical protein VFU37_12450, partial [Pyrinomonadaceae bacterium]|nr:hypothetical protein [Pyrinomonadaceae bacterium]